MKVPQRILHLEDSPGDAELIATHLEQGGLGADLVWVTTLAAFQQALEAPWDLILADYSLPGVRDRKALELALERCPEVPFIYLSGTMGEATAIECLHHGAADYILKQGLNRLVPAVRRALAEAAERRARWEAEAALRASEANYRHIVETSHEGIWLLDADSRTTFANRRMAEMLAVPMEELQGASLWAFLYPEQRAAAEALREQCSRGVAGIQEFRFRRGDGAEGWALVSTTPRFTDHGGYSGAMVMATDMTSLKAAEAARDQLAVEQRERLLQGHKLESMGTLAGGVAHDVNNLLTVFFIHMDLIQAEGLATAALARHFKPMVQAAEQVKALVGGLLSFARKREPRRLDVDLNQLVLEVLDLFGPLLGPGVSLRTTLEAGLPLLLLDGGQVRQVVMNLVINARDALDSGGTIRLTTWTRPEGVILEVSDTGQGIAPELISRIFEPLFTTKAEGKGTGLGLAVVYGIVTAHGGTIQCSSTVGEGTRFRVTFPAPGPRG
ncbi:MAG: ATP-binding protein [Holophaga sp.]|nr:ATP-binding protein [Holophaga sp.]